MVLCGKKKSMSKITVPSEFYDQNDSDNVCFLCGNPHYTLKYHVTHFDFPFDFKTCQCGIEKQTPMPNEKFFEWFFNSDVFYSAKNTKKKHIWGFYDYFKDEPSRLATSQRRYKKLSHIFEAKKPLNIMKVGPSTGTFLYVAKQHGHNAIGCDVSAEFVSWAKEKYDVQIDHGRFEKMDYKDGQFDVLLLFNVIENIPNQDEFFKAVNQRLTKGGHFIFNFVDETNNWIAKLQKSRYFLYRPPICYIYTYKVIEKIMAKYGFKIVSNLPDVRYMHLEKIFTLLNWNWTLPIIRALKINKINFPIFAYPSRIIVAEKL